MSSEIEVKRTEKKYSISVLVAAKLKAALSLGLKNDPYNSGDGYLVRSLYFDTIYNDDYEDKISGLESRRKIRLRTYNPKAETLKLELKEKHGQSQLKRSLIISKQTAQRLIQGEYSCLKEYVSKLAQEFFYIMLRELYRPKCVVEYSRLAYIVRENNIRVNIDRDIKVTEASYDIFSQNLNLYPISRLIVLEVKYNHFLLDYVKDMINMADKTEMAISKYCMARQISYL